MILVTRIAVIGAITLTKTDGRSFIDINNRLLTFKNNAPFTNCMSKIKNVLIDNAEDLDVVKPMYNLLEYCKNYEKTTENLRNYYRDEPDNLPLNPILGGGVELNIIVFWGWVDSTVHL